MTAPSPAGAAVNALQTLFAAHAAAVFGYPLVGVHLDDPNQVARARSLEEAHATTRDAIAGRLAALGAVPAATPTAPPAEPITSPPAAQKVATALEDAVAAACRFLLVTDLAATSAQRTATVAALTTAAKDASYWRALATPDRPTVPFAGVTNG
jgi:hypothetical protein